MLHILIVVIWRVKRDDSMEEQLPGDNERKQILSKYILIIFKNNNFVSITLSLSFIT